MIDHRRAIALAATALDFPLDVHDRDWLAAHLSDCATCQAEAAGFRRDAAQLAALPPIAPPSWVRARIGRPRRSNPFVLLAAAAVLLAAAALAIAVGGGILRDRTAVLMPTPTPSQAVVKATGVPGPTSDLPTASVPPTVAPAAILDGRILLRRTDPAETEPVPVSFGLYNVAGGGYVSLGVAVDAAFSVDGTRIHLVQEDATCTPTLVTVDLRGVETERISGSFQPGDGPFAWSADDQKVVFGRYTHGQPAGMCHSQGGVYSEAELESATYVIDLAAAWAVGAPLIAASAPAAYSWAPDGRSFSIADSSPRLGVVDTVTGDVIDLRPSVLSIGAADLWYARWAPDGKSIAFVYSGSPGSMVGNAVVASQTSSTIGQYGTVTNAPAWSPDSASIAVVRANDGGYLTLLSADGKGQEVLLEQAQVNELAPFGFSPDGSWLAGTLLDGEVVAISVNGLEAKPLFVPPAGTTVQFVGWSGG